MDVPKAPKLLGSLVGLGIAENAVPITKLADLYGKVEDTETRRQGVAEALLYVKASTVTLSTSNSIDQRYCLAALCSCLQPAFGLHSHPGCRNYASAHQRWAM